MKRPLEKVKDLEEKIMIIYSLFYSNPFEMEVSRRERKYFDFILSRPSRELDSVVLLYQAVREQGNKLYMLNGARVRLPRTVNSLFRAWSVTVNTSKEVGIYYEV